METHYEKYGKKCYEKNKNKWIETRRNWNKNHRSNIRVIAKRYALNHKKEEKIRYKKYEKTIEAQFRTYTYQAKRKGNEMLIDINEFYKIVSKPCIYCGELEKRRGIDRIDNSKGYTKENSASCCILCNFMKKAMKVNDFLSHIKKIAKYNE